MSHSALFWRVTHKFSMFGPPAMATAYATVMGLAAQANSGTDPRAWFDNQMVMWRAVVLAPYAIWWLLALVALWLLVVLWSGAKMHAAERAERPVAPAFQERKTSHFRQPRTVTEERPRKPIPEQWKASGPTIVDGLRQTLLGERGPLVQNEQKFFPPTITQEIELMPLKRAAQRIYSEFGDVLDKRAPVSGWKDPELALPMSAHLLIGDGLIPIWGIYPPATWLKKIPEEDASTYGFNEDATQLVDQFDARRRYVELQIDKRDFSRRLEELRAEYGDAK